MSSAIDEEILPILSFKEAKGISPLSQKICSKMLSDKENTCLKHPAFEYLYFSGLKNNGQTSPIDIMVFSLVSSSLRLHKLSLQI